MHKFIGIIFCAAPILWLCLYGAEEGLLRAGVLNKKDMTFVGNETGSLWEHLTNIWHCDAALMVLLLLALPCPIVGLVVLRKARRKRDTEHSLSRTEAA